MPEQRAVRAASPRAKTVRSPLAPAVLAPPRPPLPPAEVLEQLASVERLVVRPGEALLLKFRDVPDPQWVEALGRWARQALPGVSVLMTDPTVQLGVVAAADNPTGKGRR